MTTFQFTAPDGKNYQVEGPEGATSEQAFGMLRRMARAEGVLGGSSAGANMYAAIAVAKELGAGKRIVTIVPDSAERYLSKGVLEESVG